MPMGVQGRGEDEEEDKSQSHGALVVNADGDPRLLLADRHGTIVSALPSPVRDGRRPGRGRAVIRRAGGPLLLALVFAGCATAGVERVPPDLLADRSPGRYVEGVPFIPQRDNYCGPASLAMVLRYWGERIDQDEVARALYLPSVKGTLNLDLEFYARRRGYRAESFRGTLARLKAEVDRGRPLIVFQDQGVGPLALLSHGREAERGSGRHLRPEAVAWAYMKEVWETSAPARRPWPHGAVRP